MCWGSVTAWKRILKSRKRKVNPSPWRLLRQKAVNDYVNAIPGVEQSEYKNFQTKREHALLQRTGYVDGKTFRNAGDKERLEI